VVVAGRVRTQDGKPLHVGITVRIEADNRLALHEKFADSDGEFEFLPIPPSEVWLVVMAAGYETVRLPLDLRWKKARQFIRVELVPEEKDPRTNAEAPALTDHAASRKARDAYKKGRRALEQGEYSKAQNHFEEAVGEYPCYARAQTDLAMALAGQNLADPAETALRKSLECDPDYHAAYALLGMIFNSQQRYAESEQVLLEGLRRAPSAWRLHYQMGVCQYGQNRYAKAEEHYLRALSLHPDRPADVHARLADVYLKQGAYRRAYEQLEASLIADPMGRYSEAIRRRMTEIEFSGVLRRPPAETATSPEPEPPPESGPVEQE
jgi:tetratricopeptide (TPR) repeat protein